MINTILDLTKEFMSIESTKDNTAGLAEVIDIAKGALSGFTIEDFSRMDRPSILVYKGVKPQRNFKIILDAHLDVVAGRKEQFQAVEKDGRLYGRGSNDMKAAAAVELLVFKELAEKLSYPIALQLVTDEEIGGFDGAKYQVEQGVRADFIIAGEPTDYGINNEAKGIVWAKIRTSGKTGHGAYVWNGENALWKLNNILSRIACSYPTPRAAAWQTTANLARIETGNLTFNKIPDNAQAWIDFRYIPEESGTIAQTLKKIVGDEGEIEFVENEPSQFTDKKNPFVKKLAAATRKITGQNAETIVKHGGSDIRHFNGVGCDGVTFGPVGEGLHSDNEWVDIKSLLTYYEILKEFLLTI